MYGIALPLYEEAGDLVGQGNVYDSKGSFYNRTGDNSMALKMYDKAMFFFKTANEPRHR